MLLSRITRIFQPLRRHVLYSTGFSSKSHGVSIGYKEKRKGKKGEFAPKQRNFFTSALLSLFAVLYSSTALPTPGEIRVNSTFLLTIWNFIA